MKKILSIAALMLLTAASFAQDGKSIYKKYSEANKVSAVYISPAMFRMIGKIPNMEVGDEDVNLTPVIKSLNSLYLISSENTDINSDMKRDIDSFVRSGDYELLMEVKDEGEIVHIYTVTDKDMVKSFVLMTYDKEECTFICLDGEMPRQQLEELLVKAGK